MQSMNEQAIKANEHDHFISPHAMSFPNFVPTFLLLKKKKEIQRSTSFSLTHSHMNLNFVVHVCMSVFFPS